MEQKELSEIRKRWGLSQAEMAAVMEVSSALIISQWENGYRKPSGIVKKLYRLLNELSEKDAGKLLDWLMSVRLSQAERRKIQRNRSKD